MQWIASVGGETSSDVVRALASPPPAADVVELRLDLLPGLDVATALAASPLPVLATLRSQSEGGRGPDDPAARRAILAGAVEAGVHLVDIEWARDLDTRRALGLRDEQVLVSWHDPAGTPENLAKVAAALFGTPAALIKIVTRAASLADVETVLSLYRPEVTPARRNRERLIAFAMGAVGLPSRYLAPLVGAPVGFAAWSGAAPAAPGQQTAAAMEAAIGHLSGRPQRLFAVVGADVSRSLSPRLYGAAFRASGHPDALIPVSVADPGELAQIFRLRGETFLDRLGFNLHGLAVTTPFKERAAAAATTAAPRVRRAGAANTLILKPEAITAENTDADGVTGSLRAAGFDLVGRTALVQGTGGAARGAAVGLDLGGADVRLRSRDDERAERTAAAVAVGWRRGGEFGGADVLVNATPLGRSEGDPLPFSSAEIEGARAVVDMVYGDRPTALVSAARTGGGGVVVVDGRTMLAYQGMAQFAAFTQSAPPREAMLEAVRASSDA